MKNNNLVPINRIIIILIIIFGYSCSKKPVNKSIVNDMFVKDKKVKQESFESFYNKFHSDSIFQINRLQTPIKGKRIEYDTSYSWTKENWEIIKFKVREIDTSEFNIKIIQTETYVNEEVEYKYQSGFHFDSKYRLINGKWYLIECNDINL